MRTFAYSLARLFEIGAVETHVGIASYDNPARIVLELQNGYRIDLVEAGINQTTKVYQGSDLIQGLRLLRQDFFTTPRGERANYPNFAFVFMAGEPTVTGSTLASEIANIDNANIVLNVIDFGSTVSVSTLEAITSSTRYWRIPANSLQSESALESYVQQWSSQFCPYASYLSGGAYKEGVALCT
jgi:hypothetical protein